MTVAVVAPVPQCTSYEHRPRARTGGEEGHQPVLSLGRHSVDVPGDDGAGRGAQPALHPLRPPARPLHLGQGHVENLDLAGSLRSRAQRHVPLADPGLPMTRSRAPSSSVLRAASTGPTVVCVVAGRSVIRRGAARSRSTGAAPTGMPSRVMARHVVQTSSCPGYGELGRCARCRPVLEHALPETPAPSRCGLPNAVVPCGGSRQVRREDGWRRCARAGRTGGRSGARTR